MSRIDVRVTVRAKLGPKQVEILLDLLHVQGMRPRGPTWGYIPSCSALRELAKKKLVDHSSGGRGRIATRLTSGGFLIAKELDRRNNMSELERLAELGRRRG